ncbi:MAG: CinA family nicotinamide mononucleotide deamidase-related protein [Chloroflexota bacterium]|nr:CinA family nicotinamide mononucleotide deamidase-related protein [Chloroflexota bacterium]
MNAEIVSVGTELLLGNITDTNATYLTRELAALGINCYWVSQVGDNLERLRAVLARAFERSDLTIVTGGVGPTEDDLTREAIAAVLGEAMIVQPALEAELRAFFAGRSLPMPPSNIKQATCIASGTILLNPVGTAPGWWVERAGHIIVAMPGVPHEMMRMWSHEAAPRLAAHTGGQIVSRTLKVLGIGESAAEAQVLDLIHGSNPTLATYAKNDGIHLRLTARAGNEATARTLLAPLEAAVRARLGDAIWGVDDEPLEDVLTRLLGRRDQRLAVVEVGGATGGALARLLTAATDPSRVVATLTVPSTELAAVRNAGLDFNVEELSSEVGVQALAAAATAHWGASAALVTVGPLPAGRDDARVRGDAWIAALITLADGATRHRALRLPIQSARGEVKRLMALAALNLLRKLLLEEDSA